MRSDGLKPILRRMGFSPSGNVNGFTIALGLLVLLGAGSWLRDVTQPYKSTTTLRPANSPNGSGSKWRMKANWSRARPIGRRTSRPTS